jgi:hypothetical protein
MHRHGLVTIPTLGADRLVASEAGSGRRVLFYVAGLAGDVPMRTVERVRRPVVIELGDPEGFRGVTRGTGLVLELAAVRIVRQMAGRALCVIEVEAERLIGLNLVRSAVAKEARDGDVGSRQLERLPVVTLYVVAGRSPRLFSVTALAERSTGRLHEGHFVMIQVA